jgi:hypothetical protein
MTHTLSTLMVSLCAVSRINVSVDVVFDEELKGGFGGQINPLT